MPQEDHLRLDISDLRVELFEALDKKVNSKFDGAKELLSLTIGAALKVLAGVIILLVAIITLLGVKTASEISDSIKDITNQQIAKKLDNHNPTAVFQERVDDLYDRALIDSYLLVAERRKKERFHREKIESVDTERLLNILKRSDSELTQFKNAAVILRKLSDSTSWSSIAKEYVALLEALKPEYSFMKTDQARKEILITELAEKRYKPAKKTMKGIIKDTDQSEKLRVVAIEYLAEIGDFTAIKELESLTESTIPEIQKAAYGAIARLNPRSSKLSIWLNDYKSANKSKLEEIRYGFRIVSHLMEGNPKYRRFFGNNDPDEELRLSISKELLAHIFLSDIGFFSNTHGREKDRGLSVAIGEDPSTFYGINVDTLFGHGFWPIQSLLKDYAKSNQLKELARIIKKITIRDGDEIVAIVNIKLRENAKLTTVDGLVLDKENVPMGAGLYWDDIDNDDSLQLVWLDKSSIRIKQKLGSIDNPEGISFSLKTDFEFEDTE